MSLNAISIAGLSTTKQLSPIMRLPLQTVITAANVIENSQNMQTIPRQLFDQIKDQLSPLKQGEILRELDKAIGSGQLSFNPLDDLAKLGRGAIDLGRKSVDWLRDAASQVKDELSSLSSSAANALADSMRGPNARNLTAGEIRELRKVFGNSINLSNVRIVNGPGYNPDAKIAFDLARNPAITEGNTVYMKSNHYSKDFSTSLGGIEMLAHEFAHVRQYQQMGFGRFFAKYAQDLVVIGNADQLYKYQDRPSTTYRTETLEGQAQMVGHYANYKAGGKMTAAKVQDIENRLRGTGLFGL